LNEKQNKKKQTEKKLKTITDYISLFIWLFLLVVNILCVFGMLLESGDGKKNVAIWYANERILSTGNTLIHFSYNLHYSSSDEQQQLFWILVCCMYVYVVDINYLEVFATCRMIVSRNASTFCFGIQQVGDVVCGWLGIVEMLGYVLILLGCRWSWKSLCYMLFGYGPGSSHKYVLDEKVPGRMKSPPEKITVGGTWMMKKPLKWFPGMKLALSLAPGQIITKISLASLKITLKYDK